MTNLFIVLFKVLKRTDPIEFFQLYDVSVSNELIYWGRSVTIVGYYLTALVSVQRCEKENIVLELRAVRVLSHCAKMTSRLEKERAKQIQEKCQNLLTQMLRDEDNKYCVDCDAKGSSVKCEYPTDAS